MTMKRRILMVASAASLLLCFVFLILWPLSYRYEISFGHERAGIPDRRSSDYAVVINNGRLIGIHAHLWNVTKSSWYWDVHVQPDRGVFSVGWAMAGAIKAWRFGGFGFAFFDPSDEISFILYMPIWVPPMFAAIAPVRLAYRRMQRIYRRKAHRCLECGYDLRASKTTCPECGTAISNDSAASVRKP
jgi:hypothetical protein